MSIKSIDKFDNIPSYEYFSYFNHKLFDSPILTQEEKLIRKSELDNELTEDSKSNDLYQNINNNINIEDKFIPLNLLELSPTKDPLTTDEDKSPIKDCIKPELHKYILPKSLFDSGKNKAKANDIHQSENTDEINNEILCDEKDSPIMKHLDLFSQPYVPKNKILQSLLINNNALMENKTKTRKKKEKKKKKNNFVKREGDWICYKCKNLNFAFRNVCNKCKLPKEESEKLLFDIGNELMKLADLSIYNKSNVI